MNKAGKPLISQVKPNKETVIKRDKNTLKTKDAQGNETVVEETKETSIVRDQEPPFIKLYLEDVLWLNNNPKWYNQVLSELLKITDWGNEIILNKAIKKRILNKTGLKSLDSVNKAIYEMARSNILIRKERGIYILNPLYFGKGKWHQVRSVLITLKYDENERVVTTQIDENC